MGAVLVAADGRVIVSPPPLRGMATRVDDGTSASAFVGRCTGDATTSRRGEMLPTVLPTESLRGETLLRADTLPPLDMLLPATISRRDEMLLPATLSRRGAMLPWDMLSRRGATDTLDRSDGGGEDGREASARGAERGADWAAER